MKVPVCIRDRYVVYLEWFNNYLWLHADVSKWTKTTKKELVCDLDTLQSLLPLPLVALVKEEDKKLEKFIKLVGLKPAMKINLNDGSSATVFSWRK